MKRKKFPVQTTRVQKAPNPAKKYSRENPSKLTHTKIEGKRRENHQKSKPTKTLHCQIAKAPESMHQKESPKGLVD